MNFKELAKSYFSDVERYTCELCSIDSVYDEKTKTDDMPYGRGVNNALNYLLNFGKSYGLESKLIDNRVCEITFGSGKRLISVFAHTDVVPVTGKWTNHPFEPTYRDGKIYGRGTSDDKGPLMAAFFASKLLLDNDLIKDYRIKLVIGGDEERGGTCLEHYFSHKETEIPTFGITPDADFPVVYGEKGISTLDTYFDVEIPNVKEINAGVVPNAVIDKAAVTLVKEDKDFIKYLTDKNIEIEVEGNDVIFFGKAAHGSTPELGVNSAIIALRELANYYKVEKLANLVKYASDYTGKAFSCFYETDNLGATTYNIGLLWFKNNQIRYITNFRHPEIVDVYKVAETMDKIIGTNTKVLNAGKHLLFDRESTLIKSLMKAYQAETGDMKSKPMYLGGGTYAKEAKNTVAFGVTFPGENTHMHEPDEFMDVEHLHMCISIIAHALYLLGTVDYEG